MMLSLFQTLDENLCLPGVAPHLLTRISDHPKFLGLCLNESLIVIAQGGEKEPKLSRIVTTV